MKLGNFGLGFGAEKNDESDRESLTGKDMGFASFFTVTLKDEAGVTAAFFAGGAALAAGGSLSFRFFSFTSGMKVSAHWSAERSDVTHPQSDCFLPVSWQFQPTNAISALNSTPYPGSLRPDNGKQTIVRYMMFFA